MTLWRSFDDVLGLQIEKVDRPERGSGAVGSATASAAPDAELMNDRAVCQRAVCQRAVR